MLTLFPDVGRRVIGQVSETIGIEEVTDSETVGGYVGGVTAPLIASATGLVLAGTFLLTGNETRREAAEARASQDREQFFRMLEFHRQNVAELDVADLEGRGRSRGRRAFALYSRFSSTTSTRPCVRLLIITELIQLSVLPIRGSLISSM